MYIFLVLLDHKRILCVYGLSRITGLVLDFLGVWGHKYSLFSLVLGNHYPYQLTVTIYQLRVSVQFIFIIFYFIFKSLLQSNCEILPILFVSSAIIFPC